jgi:hypothetical protein
MDSKAFMENYGIEKPILSCKIEIVWADKFSEFFTKTDTDAWDLYRSWSIADIRILLKKVREREAKKLGGDGEGGMSGELFLLSTNKKWILKTISSEEAELFNQLIEDQKFMDRVSGHSLIGRIFG